MKFAARVVVTGLAVGRARIVQAQERESNEAQGDRAERWREAERRVKSEIAGLRARTEAPVVLGLLDLQQVLLDDPMFVDAMKRAVADEEPLASAMRARASELARLFVASSSEVVRARAEDVLGVARRLVAHLSASADIGASHAGEVVFTPVLDVLGAVELASTRPAGVVVGELSELGHAAIVLRSVELPTMVCPDAVAQAREGMTAIVDGVRCVVTVDANPAEARDAERRACSRSRRLARRTSKSGASLFTRDGHAVRLYSNVDVIDERLGVTELFEGVGLCRTELALARTWPLDAEAQFRQLAPLVERAGQRRVVVRAFDWGGDKPAPAALGPSQARGTDMIFDDPAPFEAQAEALMRLAANTDVRWLLPKVEGRAVLAFAHELIERVGSRLHARGVAHRVPPVGAMIESALGVDRASELAPHADFFSIGTSDLTASLLTCPRAKLERDMLLDPQVLRALARVQAQLPDADVCLCGDGAAEPELVSIAFGLGFRAWTVSPSMGVSFRKTVTKIEAHLASELAERALRLSSRFEVRALF